MKARIEKRIGKYRTPLQDVIPLDTPYLVFLDPSDICNAHCEWCPSGNAKLLKSVGRIPQYMRWDLYCKIINDLCAMPQPIKTLRLYKDGEPLLNPAFIQMTRLAKDTGRFGQVDTTTNGRLLNMDWSREIIYSGLDKIFISVPVDYTQEYRENVKFLYKLSQKYFHPHVHCKVTISSPYQKGWVNMPARSKFIDKFFYDFGPICDTIGYEYISPCWPGVKADAPNIDIYGDPLPDKPVDACPYVFYSLAINSDGTVSICFVDWKHVMIVGDLKKESFKDIWNSEKLKLIQKSLMFKRHKIPNCKDCGQLICGAPDNIDPYVYQILNNMKGGEANDS